MTPAARGGESRAAARAARTAGRARLARTRCMASTWSISMRRCAPPRRATADAAVTRERRAGVRGHGRRLSAGAVREPRWPTHRRRACRLARARGRRARAAPSARSACRPAELTAWLGPAISREHFEVGDEVREAFVRVRCRRGRGLRSANARGRWQADLVGAGAPPARGAGRDRRQRRRSGARSRIASGSSRIGAMARAGAWRR